MFLSYHVFQKDLLVLRSSHCENKGIAIQKVKFRDINKMVFEKNLKIRAITKVKAGMRLSIAEASVAELSSMPA